MKSKVHGLQKELSESKDVKSQSIGKWSGKESSAACGAIHLTFKEIFELLFRLILQRCRHVIMTNLSSWILQGRKRIVNCEILGNNTAGS